MSRTVLRPRHVFVAVAAGGLLAGGVGASPAWAHVHPDPLAIAAGSTATIGFEVGHGCDGSPTVTVELQVPDGFTDVAATAPDGWTVAVDDDVVTWSDGSLDAETAGTFAIELTAPPTAGSYDFPLVQTCEVGSLAWIEATPAGGAEPDHPAPLLLVTDGEPTAEQLGGHGEAEPATTDSESAEGDGHDGESAESDGHDTGDEAAAGSETAVVAGADDSDDDSNTGVIVALAIGAVVVAGGAVLVVSRRRSGSPA